MSLIDEMIALAAPAPSMPELSAGPESERLFEKMGFKRSTLPGMAFTGLGVRTDPHLPMNVMRLEWPDGRLQFVQLGRDDEVHGIEMAPGIDPFKFKQRALGLVMTAEG